MLMFAYQSEFPEKDPLPQQIIDLIYADIQNGKIKESRIEEAYQRIMTLKKDQRFSHT